MKQLSSQEAKQVTEQILKEEQDRKIELMPDGFVEADLIEVEQAAANVTQIFNKTVTELAHR